MSGHSHAKTIKHAKELTDKKRGQMFSKMARVISVAVKEGGPNPETNPKLRLAFETAKKLNMPKENVERAIKKGSGEAAEDSLEEISFEAYGPGGIAIIVVGITDNKNRTLSEIKQTLNQFGGKLAGSGSVRWLFEKKGVISIDSESQEKIEAAENKESLEMAAIEAGAEDAYWQDEFLNIHTKPELTEEVKKNLEAKNIKINSVSVDWAPKEEVFIDGKTKESCQKLFEALDENEAVQEIYSNAKLDV